MEIKHDLYLGDCEDVLRNIPDNSIDLIFTSPPYADQRKKTYGGIHPNDYVKWFLPKTDQMLRVLKPRGTFILNIKEKVVNGERSAYTMELILAMRKQGWFWTEEFIWHKKIAIKASGQTGSEMLGKGCCNIIKIKDLICIRKL